MKKIVPASAHVPANILMVDDNRYGLSARKAVLQELGHTVSTAINGEEALDLVSNSEFDIVITDYRMPRMDGIELIQNIRKRGASPQIILLSAFVEPLGLCEESTGADVVISKSSGEVQTLIRSVNRLLNRRPAKVRSAH
jgi:CheY-like chemotaxis protein